MSRLVPILCAFALVASAYATSFYEQPFPDTVAQAPNIVRGKVGMSYTNWVEGLDKSKRIFTFYELSIDEVFKGDVAHGTKSVIMRELGGEKDGVGMEVAGVAHFTRGEDVVVFLGRENADGSHDVSGMMMGKFNIERKDGRECLSGAALVTEGHSPLRGHADAMRPGPDEPKTWCLDDLRSLIERQARAGNVAETKARVVSPKIPASPTAAVSAASGLSAPQLQTSPPQEAGRSRVRLWVLAILLGAVGFVGLLRRRKRK